MFVYSVLSCFIYVSCITFYEITKPGKSIVIVCTTCSLLSLSPSANGKSTLPNGRYKDCSGLQAASDMSLSMLTYRVLPNTF
jgi:hypothetical protein